MSDAELRPFPAEWERALIVVAHPDDVEWGASAAVCAWTDAGRDVRYLLLTRGEAGIAGVPPDVAGPLREAEQLRAAEIAGAREVVFLDHRDGRVVEGIGLRRDIARVIRRLRPEVVPPPPHEEQPFPGAGWNSADHRAAGRSAIDAVGDAANEWIFPELAEEGLPPWQGVRWIAICGSPRPTHAVHVAGLADRATASLAAHRRYIEALISDDTEPEDYARNVVAQALGTGDAPRVAFEIIGG